MTYWAFVSLYQIASLFGIGLQAVLSGAEGAKWAAVVWVPGMLLWGSACWWMVHQ